MAEHTQFVPAAPSGRTLSEKEKQVWLDIVEHVLTELHINWRCPTRPRVARSIPRSVEMGALAHALNISRAVPKTSDVERVVRNEQSVALVIDDSGRRYPKNSRGPCHCGPCKRAVEEEKEQRRLRDERRAAYAKSGVPKDVKAQIAEYARAGESLSAIGDLFGYDATAVWKIARSAGVKLPKLEPPLPESGLVSGLDAKLELEIACALESGEDQAVLATRLGIGTDVVASVAGAWASQPEDEQAPWSYVPWTASTDDAPVLHAVDPTRDGELVFLDGGHGGWRVELSPFSVDALEDAFDRLRRQTIKGSRKTEFDVLKESVRRFAAGEIGFGQNDRRFKSFSHGGVMLHEFKGWQARAFCALTTSRYPNGETVRRCGLLTCFIKKDDDTPDSELSRAAAARESWLEWRRKQDEAISESMLVRRIG